MKGFRLGGTHIDGLSCVLGGIVAGLLCGAGGYALGRRQAAKKFDEKLDAEVLQLKMHYASQSKGTWQNLVATTLQYNTSAVGQDPELEGLESDDSLDGTGADREDAGGELLELVDDGVTYPGPLRRDESKPYAISFEEIEETDETWQHVTVYWYELDNTLTEENGEVIRDIIGTIGPTSPAGFGGMSRDPHIRYVRNHKLEILFEVIIKKGAFASDILGYGQKQPAGTASQDDP
jgi:hypothetical protein